MSSVLFLSPRFPWPLYDGGRIRIYETLKHLARRHDITFASPMRPEEKMVDQGPVSEFCRQMLTTVRSEKTSSVLPRLIKGVLKRDALAQSYFFDTALAAKLEDLTSRRDFDIIHVEFPLMAPYLRAIKRGRAVRILSTHNIESLRFGREVQQSPWDKRRVLLLADQILARQWERKAISRFDGVTTVSEVEREWVRRVAPRSRVALVPNGVDVCYFQPTRVVDANSVTFVGSLDYPPNIDAVTWFADSVLPHLLQRRPGFSFQVVGSRPDPRILNLAGRTGLELIGQVEDIRPHLRDSAALVVPLRSGGGTRLKILQAMALGRPVISTRLGAEGLDVEADVNCLFAETEAEWVEQLTRLFESSGLAAQLGANGRRLAEEKYDWSICLSQLDELYRQLLRK